MNLVLRAVYFCATSANKWGKGLSIEDAMKAVGLTPNLKAKTNVDFYITAALFDNPNDAELENMRQCIVGDPINGSAMYYQDQSEEDSEMIKRLHIGWITIFKTKGVS